MTERLVKQELRQAETAGERALESLYTLRDTLNSAKKLGTSGSFRGRSFFRIYEALQDGNSRRADHPGKEGSGKLSKGTERRSRVPGSENGDRKFPFLCGFFL